MRQADRLLHEVPFERASSHDEVHMDLGEDFRIARGALCGDFDLAASHLLAVLLEDHHDVISSAAACAYEDHFHGPWREIATAAIRGAVHRDDMVAAGFREKRHALAGPTYGALHRRTLGKCCAARHQLLPLLGGDLRIYM